MNEFNQEQHNEQTSSDKQENVYTVGAGYGQQSASDTTDTPSTPNTQPTQNTQSIPNTQPTQNAQPTQSTQPTPENVRQTSSGYTAPSGTNYTYSSNMPPYGQGNGYYSYSNAPQPPKKKKGKGGLIALAVAGCLVLSLMMGVGGAAMVWSYMVDRVEAVQQALTGENTRPGDSNAQKPDQQNPSNVPGGNAQDSSDTQAPSEIVIRKDSGTRVVTTTGDIGDENLTYADVVALVENSVVEITTNYVVSGTMFSQYVSSGAGSGVIVSQANNVGYIVTNNHVIEGATKIIVRLKDGTELEATLVGTDSMTDLAVLTVKTDIELTTASFGESDKLVVGQEVLAIGNPLGELGGTVTNGIVSALEREVNIDGEKMTLLQTNAAVNPGNSGGGLFDMYGRLIGIVNAKSSGDDVEGLGFAIPINTVYKIITELIEHGYVRGRPALSITVSVARQQYFMQYYTYIYVTDPGNTALQVNDILYAIEGTEITSSDDISSAISGKTVGDKVEIVVLRNKKEVKVEVELIEYVPAGAQ